MLELLIIVSTGFLCGGLNAIAGGGTFITLPALIWLGIPPVVANATATTMAVPGYWASLWAYRQDLQAEGALGLAPICILAAVGGIAGASLLVVTSPDAFLALVPWLLLSATLLFACAPHLLRISQSLNSLGRSTVLATVMLLIVTTYGGYFNGGLGIIVLAALSLQGYRNIHGMNGLKSLIASILSLLSVVTFTAAEIIDWGVAAPMALANVCGAYLAARFARRLEKTDALRSGIIAVGGVMTILFFVA